MSQKRINRKTLLSLGFDENLVPIELSDANTPYIYWSKYVINQEDPSKIIALTTHEIDLVENENPKDITEDITVDINIDDFVIGSCETLDEIYTFMRIISHQNKNTEDGEISM
jgi:hypothetical protein